MGLSSRGMIYRPSKNYIYTKRKEKKEREKRSSNYVIIYIFIIIQTKSTEAHFNR